MKTFLWYKAKILCSSKQKIAGLVVTPIVFVLLHSFLGVKYDTVMAFIGLCIPLSYTYILFSVGDLFRVNCYIAAGERSKSVWLANLVFVTGIGFISSLISQALCALVFGKTISESMIYFIFSVCYVPIVALFVGLSTVHFRNYSKNEVMFASVIAVLNALVFLLPLLSLLIPVVISIKILAVPAVVGLLGTIMLSIYMGTSDNEILVRNAIKEISVYDKALLGLDEE